MPFLPSLRRSSPSILGLGLDMVEIDRIRELHIKHGELFLQRIFASEERVYCLSLKNPYPSLAARFAAKEAASKAFSTGIGKSFSWQSTFVYKGPQGEPLLGFDAKGQRLLHALGATKALLSLSHTKTFAQAIVILS
jgi:holo-[acyl-carrier protein] synthase